MAAQAAGGKPMQVLYESGFGESCGTVLVLLVGAMLAAGLCVSAILWWIARTRPSVGPYVTAPAGIGLVIGIGVGIAFWFNDESLMGVAIDGSFLEQRYCQGPNYRVQAYPMSEVTGTTYRRREEWDHRTKITTVYHYLDIAIASRGKPRSMPIDEPGETTLEALDKFAPEAMARYRISLKTAPRR